MGVKKLVGACIVDGINFCWLLPNTRSLIYLSIHLFIHSPIYPFTYLSIHLFIHSPIYPFTYLSIHLFIHSPIYPFTYLSITYLSIHLFIHSPIYPFTHQSINSLHPLDRSLEFLLSSLVVSQLRFESPFPPWCFVPWRAMAYESLQHTFVTTICHSNVCE